MAPALQEWVSWAVGIAVALFWLIHWLRPPLAKWLLKRGHVGLAMRIHKRRKP